MQKKKEKKRMLLISLFYNNVAYAAGYIFILQDARIQRRPDMV